MNLRTLQGWRERVVKTRLILLQSSDLEPSPFS